jgi:hypothetical protein
MVQDKTIPNETRDLVVRLYLAGFPYRAIQERAGISLGSITKIVEQAKMAIPDIAELRELEVLAKKSGSNPIECIRGARVLEFLNAHNIPLDQAGIVFEFCKLAKDPVKEANAGMQMIRLVQETGHSYNELLVDFDTKRDQIAELEADLQNKRNELKEIHSRLSGLKKLEDLQTKLDPLNVTSQKAIELIDKANQIEALGFEPNVALVLAGELKRLGPDITKNAKIAVELIAKYSGIEQAISVRTKERYDAEKKLSEIKQSIDFAVKDANYWKAEVARSQERIRQLGTEITKLETIYTQKSQTLKMDYDNRVSTLRAQLADLEREKQKADIKTSQIMNWVNNYIGFRTTIQGQFDFSNQLKAQIKEMEERKKKLAEEQRAMDAEIQGTTAFFNFMLSSELPPPGNKFWDSIGSIINVAAGMQVPPSKLKPAAEDVRQFFITLLRKATADDIVSRWDHQFLKNELEQCKRDLKASSSTLNQKLLDQAVKDRAEWDKLMRSYLKPDKHSY